MNLENVRLSERSQSQRAALYDSIYTSYLEQANPDTGSKLLVARARGAGKNRDRLIANVYRFCMGMDEILELHRDIQHCGYAKYH